MLLRTYHGGRLQRRPNLATPSRTETDPEPRFVLSHGLEPKYLEAAPQPLTDVAILIMEAGIRPGETVNLRWQDVLAAGLPCEVELYRHPRQEIEKRGTKSQPDGARSGHADGPKSLGEITLGVSGRFARGRDPGNLD